MVCQDCGTKSWLSSALLILAVKTLQRLPLTAFIVRVAPSPDTYIQKTKKSYIDSRARRNLGSINTELQDVQRIMVANIEEVLQRGEALSGKSMLSQDC